MNSQRMVSQWLTRRMNTGSPWWQATSDESAALPPSSASDEVETLRTVQEPAAPRTATRCPGSPISVATSRFDGRAKTARPTG